MSLTEILVAIALVLVSEELLGWMDRLSTWLVRYNARQAPPSLVARLEEEWQADMLAKPGKLSRLLFALDCRRAAFVLTEQELLPHVAPVTLLTVRAFDIAYASMTLMMALPVLALVATAVLLANRGALLERKERIGRRGKPFIAVEFRIPRNHFGRETRFGAFILRTDLYLLPRITNVVRGDMSFVGPMPLPPATAHFLNGLLPDYFNRRHVVRPGLTGLTQLELKEPATCWHFLLSEGKHDLYFVDNYSLRLVLKIMLLQTWSVLRSLLRSPRRRA